ncbi:hypothetical protein H4Q26_003615 [Puccinia striiformis f. sp. tritici PST-130]|nr:hypothetical protein H4Q26_003615 [Puccinia striiformis f. sp. tritici PST-130]
MHAENWESPQPLQPDENADLSFVNPPRAAVMPFDGQSPLAVGLQSPNFQSPNLGTRATQDVRDSAVLPKLRREHNRLEFRNPDNATALPDIVGLVQISALTLSYHLEARNTGKRCLIVADRVDKSQKVAATYLVESIKEDWRTQAPRLKTADSSLSTH